MQQLNRVSVADQGFPREGSANHKGGANLLLPPAFRMNGKGIVFTDVCLLTPCGGVGGGLPSLY